MKIVDNMNNKTSRIVYLDMAKAFAIYLVVLAHTGYIRESTNNWLSTVPLPVFFATAGIMMYVVNSAEKPFGTFVKKKLLTVMVPYFTFAASYYLLYLVAHTAHNFTGDNLVLFLAQIFTLRGYSTLWFLPVFLLGEIISFLCIKYLKKRWKLIIAALTLIAMATAAQHVYFAYRAIYCVDILSTSLYEIILTLIKSVCAAIFIIIGYLSAPFITNRDTDRRKDLAIGIILTVINILCTGINGLQDLNNLNCGFLPMFFVLGTVASTGVILICKCLPGWKWVSYFGRNSLIIMGTHLSGYVLYCGMVFASHFSTRIPFAQDWTQLILTMLFTFVFSVPIIEILNRYFPYLLGRIKVK